MTDDKMISTHPNVLTIRTRIVELLGDYRGAEGDQLELALDRKAMARLRRIRRRSREFYKLPHARRTAA